MLQSMKIAVFNARLWLLHRLPIKKNKVVIWANSFKSYGDSPKYITEYLCKNYTDVFDIVWVFDSKVLIPDDLPEQVRVIRYFSYKYLYEISTAGFVICNARTGPGHFFTKRKGQYYIQTWHSSVRLKKIEGDAGKLPEEYIAMAQEDSRKIDVLLSGCKFSTDIFRRSFWYSGEILESGTPRSDIFFADRQNEARQKVYKHYQIDEDHWMVLYAPTFRDAKKANMHGLDQEQLLSVLEAKTGMTWTLGVRMHPNIQNDTTFDHKSNLRGMSQYPDMQELIAACDLLITDYSSCMFDAAICNKPCVLFASDLNEYIQNERGLYFHFEELPFPVAIDNQQLLEYIHNFDEIRYRAQVQDFLQKIDSYEDGNAAQRVAARMLMVLGKNK